MSLALWQEDRGTCRLVGVVFLFLVAVLGLQAWVYWPAAAEAPQVVEGRAQLRSDGAGSLHVISGLEAVVFQCPSRGLSSRRNRFFLFLRLELFRQSFPCGSAAWLSGAQGNEVVRAEFDRIWRPFGPDERLLSLSHQGRVLFGPDDIRRHILGTLRFFGVVLVSVTALLLLGLEVLARRQRRRRARLLTGRL